MMESIEKLHEAFEKCTHPIKDEMIEFDTVWIVKDCAMAYLDDIKAEIERDYMKLLVDADGVPIHVGDEVTSTNGIIREVQFIAPNGIMFISPNNIFYKPKDFRHFKPCTLEDVLGDLLIENDETGGMPDIAKYAAAIRDMFGGDES